MERVRLKSDHELCATAQSTTNNSLSRQQVIEKATAELTPSANNPRVHTLRQIRLLRRSIERFGFVNPVLVDTNNRVVAGWGRVKAAQSMNMRTVPTLTIEHLSDDELRAYVIADNRLAEKAGWDRALLAIELQGLIEIGFDTETLGFEAAELDIVLEEAAEARDESKSEDVVPELTEKVVSRRDDIWHCGPHRVLCADSRLESAYEKLMGVERAALAITDPPYNVAIQGHVSGLGKIRHREFEMAAGEMTVNEFSQFLEDVFKYMKAFSTDGSVHFIFMDWRHIREVMDAGTRQYEKLLNLCVWCKTNAGMGSFYRSQHELVFAWLSRPGTHINNIELGRHGRSRSNVWTYQGANTFKKSRHEELSMHPTVKPTTLVADAIKDCSRLGDIVLDPFLGSGTALIAAEKTGRRTYGIEIDPQYTDVAIRRWQTYTGKTAFHAESGRSFEEMEIRRTRVRLVR